MEATTARRMWLVGEPVHAVTYFAPESFAAWEAAGIRGFWRGYFATRAAPFGPVGPAVVEATFFNFAPSVVRRALPSVWEIVSPAAALAARVDGSTAALRAILGEALDAGAAARSAGLVDDAVAGCDAAGRALFAANAALDWPDDPLARVWHGLTLLREHRGDGHNAALVAAGIDGCEAHVLAGAIGTGGADALTRRQARGWSDDEWAAAEQRLVDRGLVTAGGEPTDAGRDLHREVETRTDQVAMGPWRVLGEDRTAQLERLLRPLAEAVSRSGVVRFPNPMGLPPTDPA